MERAWMYESELEDVLLRQSERQYGIQGTTCLVRYLMRRFLILEMENGKLPIQKRGEEPLRFMSFWLKELAIPVNDRTFRFRNEHFSSLAFYGTPLRNIYDNLLHQLSIERILSNEKPVDEWTEAKNDVTEWLKIAKQKSQKYAKHKDIYPYYLKHHLLDCLNDTYEATVQHPTYLDGFDYTDDVLKVSEEEVCRRYILAFQECLTDGELLAEAELEEYVIHHLDEIEPGLTIVQSQYILPNGRIDVLAKDRNGQYVVIELKVEKDTDCIWQRWYYTKEIKQRFGQDSVRFIVILPEFYPEIVEPLLEGDIPTTILQFHPVIQRGKLKKATFTHWSEVSVE